MKRLDAILNRDSGLAPAPGSGPRELVSIVGAGGKTTLLFLLAHALKKQGKKILVTTTTKIFVPAEDQCDRILCEPSWQAESGRIRPGTITCLGQRIDTATDKIIGIEKEVVDMLFEKKLFDCILVEADGARQKPIKAPGTHEPVIPARTTRVLGVVGLDALGTPVNDRQVHRPDLFCATTRATANQPIDETLICNLVLSENGLFKNTPPHCTRSLILNKAEEVFLSEKTKRLFRSLEKQTDRIDVIIASAKENRVFR